MPPFRTYRTILVRNSSARYGLDGIVGNAPDPQLLLSNTGRPLRSWS